jgi:hypothetical protein
MAQASSKRRRLDAWPVTKEIISEQSLYSRIGPKARKVLRHINTME